MRDDGREMKLIKKTGYERGKADTDAFKSMKEISEQLSIKLTNFINATYNSRNNKSHERSS